MEYIQYQDLFLPEEMFIMKTPKDCKLYKNTYVKIKHDFVKNSLSVVNFNGKGIHYSFNIGDFLEVMRSPKSRYLPMSLKEFNSWNRWKLVLLSLIYYI